LYSQYINLLDQETQDFYKQHGEIFNFPNLFSLANKAHSEYISTDYEPCVIISAAGMVEGGRIQEHVKNNISNAFSTILIAGFCAEGTFGHQLLQGRQTVFINHKERRVMASIQKTDAFSAHPDHLGLLNYLKLTCGSITKKIFLVHADPFSSAALKQGIDFTQVEIASKGITYDL
jgi:metallo-beta-lactamase family protein